jgi:hypothetical protein
VIGVPLSGTVAGAVTGTVEVIGPVRTPGAMLFRLELTMPEVWVAAALPASGLPPPHAASVAEQIAIQISRSAAGCCANFMSISLESNSSSEIVIAYGN